MKKEGFTLLELLIVIVIIGVLATLAISQYKAVKENSMDKEAQNTLKLIYAQELIFKSANVSNAAAGSDTSYGGPYATNSAINSGLDLKLPTTNENWDYSVLTCTSSSRSRFTVQASRTANGYARNWCLNSVPAGTADPVPVQQSAACVCP